VDGLLLYRRELLAVKRKNAPFRGRPALPGGFVELGETAEMAVMREVVEETGLRTAVRYLVGVYSDPQRDPRGHVVSLAYALRRVSGSLRAASDAAGIVLLDTKDLPPMAFDHRRIVRDFLTRASSRSSSGRRSP
jgi:8-oxo-dGTP diphosphatase